MDAMLQVQKWRGRKAVFRDRSILFNVYAASHSLANLVAAGSPTERGPKSARRLEHTTNAATISVS